MNDVPPEYPAETSTQLITRIESPQGPLTPDGLSKMAGYLIKMADYLVKSSLLPKHIRTAGDCVLIMGRGHSLGIHPMTALTTLHMIDGKVGLPADLMVALAKSHRACRYFQLIESTVTRAVYETQRQGDPKPTLLAYTIEEARDAGLTGKDNWKKHTAAMLRARCSAALARAVYPDAVLGVYDPDELDDIAPSPPRPPPKHAPWTAPASVLTAPAGMLTVEEEAPPLPPPPEKIDLEIEAQRLHHKLCALIHNAKTHGDLAEASALIKQATRDHTLTLEQRADLIDRGVARKLAMDDAEAAK